MTDMVWRLQRSKADPYVWPFQTEEAAADFALDHGMLDWRPVQVGNPQKDHEQICARCHERWPCRHVQLDRKASQILHAEANRCARCGKQMGWYVIRLKGAGEFGEDVAYHGRKGACRNMAVREMRRLGLVDELAKLERDEQRRQEYLDSCRQSRERRAKA